MSKLKNGTQRVLAALLSLCMLLAVLPGAALAEDQPQKQTIHIASAQDLVSLAENCRLDSWSKDKLVILDKDIDLTGVDFEGIPTFGGEFQGGSHRITGVSLTQDGSAVGFFRYVQEGALINELTVSGNVVPGGSRSTVGGISGKNEGTIQGCWFTGVVSGASKVGSIAGVNESTGMIVGCTSTGVAYGQHFVGGIVGDNHGAVTGTLNGSNVNTTVEQNDVDLSDLTLQDFTTTESGTNITDVGGVAGDSSGVIRNCVNNGIVGYQHIGYNVGGIVGSQTGFVEGCTNYGLVFGRKEAGGIVGQMEPNSVVQYTEDTLQKLDKELDVMQGLLNKTYNDASATASDLTNDVDTLINKVDKTRENIQKLLDELGSGLSIKSGDIVIRDITGISGSISGNIGAGAGAGAGAAAGGAGSITTPGDAAPPEPTAAPGATPEPAAVPEPEVTPEPAQPDTQSTPEAQPDAQAAPEAQPQAAGTGGAQIAFLGTAGQGSMKTAALTETPDAAQPAADAAVQPETAAQPETTAQPGSATIVAGGVAGGVGAGAGAGVAGSVSGEGSADLNGELTVTVPDIKLDASNQVTAARNDLSSSLNDISDRVRSLTNSTGSNAQNLIDDLRAVADQMEQIGRTIAGAMDEKTTDDIYQDISDDDTVKDTEGKVLNCVNYGDVQADLNAGGITGAMARENDLDPEDDIQVVGSDSLNFTYKTRVVLRQCVNYGTVSAKKQNAGGIVGNMEMGTVLGVLNLGTLDAEDAANVGGVAGKSSAPIRQSSAKCRLTGKSQVGGIAGTGKEIIDCRSLVVVDACDEARGAIAGTVADDSTLERNYFVSASLAGVDGVSYAGQAEPMNFSDFVQLENLPDVFRSMTVIFRADGKTVRTFSLNYGDELPKASLPEVPAKDGYYGTWGDFEGGVITFDEAVDAVYTAYDQLLESDRTREDGKAILMVEGNFPDTASLTVSESSEAAPGTLLESWQLTLNGTDGQDRHSMRYLPTVSPNRTAIYVKDDNGAWRKADTRVDGSYVVFEMSTSETVFCAVQTLDWRIPAGIGAAALLLVLALILGGRKHRKKKKAAAAAANVNL